MERERERKRMGRGWAGVGCRHFRIHLFISSPSPSRAVHRRRMLLLRAARTARLLSSPGRAQPASGPGRRPGPNPLRATAAATAPADGEPTFPSASDDVLRAVARSIPGPYADALADALLAYGALSASVEEDREGRPETPLFGPDRSGGAVWPACRVAAIFPGGADVAGATAASVAAAGLPADVHAWDVSPAPPEEWVGSLHGDFQAVCVNEGRGLSGGSGGSGVPLWVVPAWCESPPDAAGATVVRLTPGLAFGTGDHPTTRLCLRWLAGGIRGGGGGERDRTWPPPPPPPPPHCRAWSARPSWTMGPGRASWPSRPWPWARSPPWRRTSTRWPCGPQPRTRG